MKKTLIAIFSLWASFAGAQTNIIVPNGGNQATEEWVKQYADAWLKRLDKPPTTEEPPVDVPDPTDPTNPIPCTAAPALPVVTNITTSSLRMTVSATGITNINWFIYATSNPSVTLRSGTRTFDTVMDIGWTTALPSGSYGLRIQGVNCTGTSSKNFDIEGTTPTLDPCSAGPTLTNIYDASTKGLTLQFHGNNVTILRYIVKDSNGSAIRTADVVPQSSTIIVTFSSPIPAGAYTLRIEGVNCSGFSEQAFTAVSVDLPGNNDPPVEPYPATVACSTTPQIVAITNIGNTDIKVALEGFGVLKPGTPTGGTPTNPLTPPTFTGWNVGGWSGSVWRPGDYTSSKTYPVIYIHDASTLYDDTNPNGTWDLNDRVQALINSGTIEPSIIVAINTPDRMRTLLPNKPFYTMSQGDQNTIAFNNGGTPLGDQTISFMVNQLKPYIDQTYSTKKDRTNTTVMGASMGGIFAIYAFTERNDVFGKMAALSPHYQGTLNNVNDNLFTDDMVNYINANFPNANTGGKVYMDRGTTSLDENYATPQNQVNSILAGKGYTDANYKKTVYEGGGHTNAEWGQHVPAIFTFLFPRTIETPPVVVPSTSINWYVYKTSAPLLYLKKGNVAFGKTINLSWTGELAAGDYGLRIQAVNCQGVVTKNFIIPQSTNPIPCASAPVINGISLSSKTFLTFNWSGLNVPEVVWNIKQNGNTIRSGSFIPDANQNKTIQYNELGPGTYQLQLVGLSCSTTNPPVSFTLENTQGPIIAKGKKYITMNCTGYGFDKSSPSGIANEWMERIEAFLNMEWQGQKFKGIGGIQLNVKWYEYEPNEGNFDDATMQKVVNYCAQRGLVLSIAFVPYLRENDNRIPQSDRATLVDGSTWWVEGRDWIFQKTYMPSMNSDIGRAKFRAAAKHMSQYLKQFSNVDFMTTVTAQTEEYQLVRQEHPLMITGFSQIDLQKWASYSGGKPVTRPNPQTGEEGVYNWIGGAKQWGDFQTEALRGFHAEFVRGVREGGMRTSAFYAGIGAPSGAFDFSTRLDRIYSAGTSDQPDIIYSSEGGSNSLNSKIMATDLNLGTFPGSDYAIEFDPEDLSRKYTDFPPYDTQLFGEDLWYYASSFFRRGGHIIHMAMAFHPQANVHHLSEAMYKIKTQFLDSNSGMTGMPQGEQINHTTTYYGGQSFRDEWSNRGAGVNKQVKIKLQ